MQDDFFDIADCQSDGKEDSYYDDESDEDGDESDLDSQSSLYQFVLQKKTFASLNVMLLMQYAEGYTLRAHIDKQGS